jgi:hypothetical protein
VQSIATHDRPLWKDDVDRLISVDQNEISLHPLNSELHSESGSLKNVKCLNPPWSNSDNCPAGGLCLYNIEQNFSLFRREFFGIFNAGMLKALWEYGRSRHYRSS